MKKNLLYRLIAAILIAAIFFFSESVYACDINYLSDNIVSYDILYEDDEDTDIDTSVASLTDATLTDPVSQLNCKAAAVIDVKTGNMLFEYNADKAYYPGGLIKLMTALVVFEKASSSDIVQISNNKYYAENADSLDVVLYSGESIPIKDLLYGLLLKSGEEAAFAISEYVSGNVSDFAAEMNSVAADLGCKNSTFSGPNNDFAGGSKCSASDMALVASALYKHPLFRTIIETENYYIPATNKSDERELWQDNRMKYYANTDYYYKYHIGGKVGYSDIGGCFVSFAEKNGMTIACVVMGTDPQEMIYSDTVKLCNHVFNSYERIYPLRGYKLQIDLGSSVLIKNYYSNVGHSLPYYYLNDNICINVEKGTGIDNLEINPVLFPQPEGLKAGKMEIYYKGKLISESDIMVGISSVYDISGQTDDTSKNNESDDKKEINNDTDKKVRKIAISSILILAGMICFVILILLIIITHFNIHKKMLRKKKNKKISSGGKRDKKSEDKKSEENSDKSLEKDDSPEKDVDEKSNDDEV